MNTPNFQRCISHPILMLLLICSTGHAQVYKWVDAEGKTHYSEKKEDAGKFKTEELKVPSQPASPQTKKSSAQYWQEQDAQFRQRQIEQSYAKPYEPPARPKVPKSLSGGRSDDTAASKCNLARDVLSGAVRHRNGARTDKYDIDLAKEDVQAYCR